MPRREAGWPRGRGRMKNVPRERGRGGRNVDWRDRALGDTDRDPTADYGSTTDLVREKNRYFSEQKSTDLKLLIFPSSAGIQIPAQED